MSKKHALLIVSAAITLGVTYSAPVFAQSTSSAEITSLLACQSETDDTKRLDCYDMAVRNFARAQEEGEIFTVSKEQIENVERDSFGFNIPSIPMLGSLLGGGNTTNEKSNPLTDPVEVKTAERTKAPKRPKIPALGESKGIKNVNLNIIKTQDFGYKKIRFFMENGQVWEQTDTSRVRVPRITKTSKPVADIRKGSLGSYLLQVNGQGRAVPVKRVR